MIEYANTIDDLVAFTAFHVKTSRVAQRALRAGTLMLGLSSLVLVSGIAIAAGQPHLKAAVIGVFASVGATVGYRLSIVRSALAHTRRLYSEGRNKGVVGSHRLLLTDAALREESEGGVTETKFSAVERIAESPSHVFIYVGALNAHVIPRNAVSEGELAAFLDELKARVAEGAC